MATAEKSDSPEVAAAEEPWGQPGELPRLLSQNSLRQRSFSALQSQLSLNAEGAPLLRTGSLKVNVSTVPNTAADGAPETARRKAIRSRLEDLDKDRDGVVSKDELVEFIEHTIATEQRLRHVTWLAAGLAAFTLVLLGSFTGLTYYVVDMHKDSSAAGGAWADRSSLDTLRTAHGGFLMLNYTATPIPRRAVLPGAARTTEELLRLKGALDADIAAGGANAAFGEDMAAGSSGRGLLTAKGAPGSAHGPPLGVVDRANAETACRWLTEGNIDIPLKIVNAFGSHFPAGPAKVVEAKGCKSLAKAGNSKREISGTLVYHKITYVIMCRANKAKCSIRYAPHSGPHAGGTAKKKGRRLTADGEPDLLDTGCPPVEIGGALQPVLKLSDGTCPQCFPAGALATLEDGSRRPVGSLAVGDCVQVIEEDGSLGFSTVYLFPHFTMSGSYEFVRVSAGNASITLSADHYLYVAPSATAAFSERVAKPAAAVAPGDMLWRGSADGGLSLEAVSAVATVRAPGLVNPFTMKGNIVVDGVAASVYNTAMGSEARMHAFTAAGRALWRRFPRLLRAAHRLRLAQPISLAMGNLFAKHLAPATSSNPALHWAAVRLAAAPGHFASAIA